MMVCSLHRERCQQKECRPKSEWFRNEEVRDNLISKGDNTPFLFTTTQ
jgi:hypothetical protein